MNKIHAIGLFLGTMILIIAGLPLLLSVIPAHYSELRDSRQQNLTRTELREPFVTFYEIAVTGTENGCPCAYEVWEAKVPTGHPDLEGTNEDNYAYDGNRFWRLVYSQYDCLDGKTKTQ